MTTFGPILSIKGFHDNDDDGNLFLIREKEWICILNLEAGFYARILRIPLYDFYTSSPSNNYLFIDDKTDEDDPDLYFTMIWGSKGNKVAKYKIRNEVIAYIRDLDHLL